MVRSAHREPGFTYSKKEWSFQNCFSGVSTAVFIPYFHHSVSHFISFQFLSSLCCIYTRTLVIRGFLLVDSGDVIKTRLFHSEERFTGEVFMLAISPHCSHLTHQLNLACNPLCNLKRGAQELYCCWSTGLAWCQEFSKHA